MTRPRSHSPWAGKSEFDPGSSAAPKPALFHSRPVSPFTLHFPTPSSPPLCSRGRPAPPLPHALPVAAAEPRGGARKPRPRSARAAAPAGQCCCAPRRARCPRSPPRALRQPPRGRRRAWRPAGQTKEAAARRSRRGPTDHGLGARAAGPSPEDPAPPGPALGARLRRPGRAAGRTRSPCGAEEAAAAAAEREGRRGGRPARAPEPWASAAGAARSSPSAACSW